MFLTASFIMLNAQEVSGQSISTLKNEKGEIQPTRIETRKDQNMPSGFRRDQIVGFENGQEKTVGSLFWFEKGSTKAQFLTKQNDPSLFSPQINYEKINQKVQNSGSETVIAFAGAYKGIDGNIEGVAIEDGVSVGSSSYSKSGFVYIDPSGHIELSRLKNEQTNQLDQVAADNLVSRAKAEHGDLFQQIPAIWQGVEKLDSHSPNKFEWRSICQTRDGRQFVLNCSEKITLRDYLIMALNLKDANGEQLVYDLMMTDTGAYSEGVFRDKNQVADHSSFKSHLMIDENVNDPSGYTNVVVIGTK